MGAGAGREWGPRRTNGSSDSSWSPGSSRSRRSRHLIPPRDQTPAGARTLERALAEAFRHRLTDRPQLLALLERYGRRPGSVLLRHLLAPGFRPVLTRSEAEERFLALIRRARVPDPEGNVLLEGYEVDFLWRRERVVVEVDGRAFHASDRSFEADRRRDAALVAAGFRVMRVTWNQVVNEPYAVIVRLARALA